jgi:MoaA/NifB/PqqE/SkfB family radical SAM enzyme
MNPSGSMTQLPIAILFPHNRCNCRCVMCDIWKIDAVEEIGLDELERHARDFEALGTRWVVFSGGEPLLHSDLFRLAERLRRSAIRTTVCTTGLLLGHHAAAVARLIDDVIVSLDGPPEVHDRIRRVPRAFELLRAGIERLRAERAEYPIGARCVVQRENFRHLGETVQTARELALASISFLAADLSSSAFNRSEPWPRARRSEVALEGGEIVQLEREIERLIAEAERAPGFILETPEKLRRIVLHYRAEAGLAEPEAPRCNAPWVSAVVESDGTVRPCFFHAPIGNTRGRTLSEVLNAPEAVAFRQALDVARNPICRRCVCSLEFRGPSSA